MLQKVFGVTLEFRHTIVSKMLIIKTTLLPEMCQTHKISKAALYQYIKPRKETDDPQYQQKPV